MIKNVVFDYGQVLVHFEPYGLCANHATDPEDIKLLAEIAFDRLYWDRLDAGTITHEEVSKACRERLPEHLWGAVDNILEEWIYQTPPMEGMQELVLHLKRDFGVKLVLLSNISLHFAAHAHELPVLSPFDRCIFSARCHLVKPQKEIFAYLCESCDILPEETIFIDDNAANIASAAAMGIHTYRFDGNAEKLTAYLDQLLTQL